MKNKEIININMGDLYITADDNSYLSTVGLGPCVAVAIVIKLEDNLSIRLLSHIDMGQLVGITFNEFQNKLNKMLSTLPSSILDLNITIVSGESFNKQHLTPNEKKLLDIILDEFSSYNIDKRNLNVINAYEVLISPNGDIKTYDFDEIMKLKYQKLNKGIKNIKGKIDPLLHIYITKYGAYMTDSSLPLTSTTEEKNNNLNGNYYKELKKRGFNIILDPSFNNDKVLAYYIQNWESLNKNLLLNECQIAYNYDNNIQKEHIL